MHVIARPTLEAAATLHPDVASWLHAWWTIATKAEWQRLEHVRAQYAAADQVNRCLIFDVRGNNYRLICRVTWADRWQRGTLLIKHFLTHAEYDRGRWRNDCS